MSFESKINSIIFFPSIKNGLYDYKIPLKSDLKSFIENKKFELSSPLLEYIIYKNIKNQIINNNFINNDIALITEKYLTLHKNRNNFINSNKKHLIILYQNEMTQKWNLIIFLKFMEQIKININLGLKIPIITKIISSNINSDDDNYILNKTMDELENIFNFKIPDDVNFEVDSINISEHINTSIFIINFINGLISKKESNLNSYIKELFNEKMISSINDKNNNNDIKKNYINHFNSFRKINENLKNILFDCENELNEYLLNINNNINFANNTLKDFQNNIDDLNSEDEEEALRIMEEHNKESKRIKKEKIKTLNNNNNLNLKSINKFGIIKEEDNESSSNSFESLSHNKKRIKKENFKNVTRNNKKNNSFNIKNNINIANISNQNKISNKKINDNILDELKESIKEFEFDQKIICKTEVNNINNKNENMIKPYKINHIKHKKNRKYLSDILARKERNGIEILLISKENEKIKNRKKNKRRIIEKKNKEKENSYLKNKSIENEKKLINIKYLKGYKDKYKINKDALIEIKSYDSKQNLKFSKKKESKINNIESPSEIKYSSRKIKNNNSIYNNSQSVDKIRNISSIKHKININKETKDSSYLLKKNANIIINNKKNLIKKLLKAKNDLKRRKNSKQLLSKLSNNSLKSTSFKSENSVNNLKIKSKDLDIKIEKSITDFSIFDNPIIFQDNKIQEKNEDFYQIINKIKIGNKENDKNFNKNITHSSLNSLNEKNINERKYNEEVEVKNNIKEFIGKKYSFKEPTLKITNKDKNYSMLPRKSNTINVDDYCYFYEGNKYKECGCIGGKNEDTFCSIF